ncbi:MAG: hypothetical protein AAF773_13500 [Cyanobacteria bacterium P01_D01_bin.115]
MSDTGGILTYRLFEDGKTTEAFYRTGDEIANCPEIDDLTTQKHVFWPYADVDPEADALVVCFGSHRRQVVAEELEKTLHFVNQFMCDLDAYDPDIGIQYLLGAYGPKRGSRYTVQNPGFSTTLPFSDREVHSVPDLVRVDYFKFSD